MTTNPIPFINIHSHHFSIEGITIQSIYENFEMLPANSYISIGIHPWYIHKTNVENALDILTKNVYSKNVLAIGECGLDKLITIDLKEQENIFKAQIKIAEQAKKPIIVHCVKAFDDLIRIKKEMKISVPMIIHGFNNNLQVAEQLIKNGFYISVGAALLNESSNAAKIISTIPIEKLFFETDDKDVSIKSIFEAAAKQLKMDVEDLKERININFNNVFNSPLERG